jgi:DNA gyrase subunit A
VSALIPVKGISDDKNLFMVTRNGIVKKTKCTDFANIRSNGINAITIQEGDSLIEVKETCADDDIIIVTEKGMAIRFPETQVRPTGRNSMGVRGISLAEDDCVVGMQLSSQGDSVLVVSEKGMGKRSKFDDFRMQNRGGKGLKCYKITEKTGNVVGIKAVNDDHEIMMITSAGIIIQIRMNEIPVHGRITSGVKLINLEEGVKVVKIAKVREDIEDDESAEKVSEELTEE